MTPPEEHVPVLPNCRTSRLTGLRVAQERATLLGSETGIDHSYRWDRDESRYVVYPIPFTAPAAPWDDERNYPPQVRPDWKRSPTQFMRIADFLPAAAGLAGRQWLSSNESHPSPAQFVRDLQAALDIQYGMGHFWASRHGSRISVQCRYPVQTTTSQ